MKIKMIVAHDESNVIGFKNTIPWKNAEDMKLFKDFTLNNTVIMGRKTWDSLPKKPLKNRINIVISSKKSESECGEIYCKKLEEAIRHSSIIGEIFIIGGASIYEEALKLDIVDEIYVSLIPGTHAGDTFFPKLDMYKKWVKYHIHHHQTFKLITYIRDRGQIGHATY